MSKEDDWAWEAAAHVQALMETDRSPLIDSQVSIIATALRAEKSAGKAEGLEMAAEELERMAFNAQKNDAISAKARGDTVHISIASNVLGFAVIRIRALIHETKEMV